MANVFIEETTLTAIADSIRAKTGTTDKIYPSDMATAIAGITGGGGEGVPAGYVTVTFMNGSTELFSRLVMVGDDCPDPVTQGRIDTPTKESTTQYTYTHNGWATADGGTADETALQNITADKVLYAAYATAVRYYTATLYDEDGVTVLHTEQVAYGSMPSYVPEKEGASFAGWIPNTPVMGDTSYTATWETVIASGTCGPSATWILYATGVLTISGTGTIERNKNTDKAYWADYSNDITDVVIEDGITTIGVYSFAHITALNSITIPPSVSTIENTSFSTFSSRCDISNLYITDLSAWINMTRKDFPLTGTNANRKVYLNGELLTSISVPEGVTTISENTFCGWNCVTEVTIPDSVTTIGNFAFRATGLRTLTIPDSVITIGDHAFRVCSKLSSVRIGENVTRIGANCFTDNSALSSVTFAVTDGWWCATLSTATSGTSISGTSLANSSTAANYLRNTYKTYYWNRS